VGGRDALGLRVEYVALAFVVLGYGADGVAPMARGEVEMGRVVIER
jgi:hypothetical protein